MWAAYPRRAKGAAPGSGVNRTDADAPPTTLRRSAGACSVASRPRAFFLARGRPPGNAARGPHPPLSPRRLLMHPRTLAAALLLAAAPLGAQLPAAPRPATDAPRFGVLAGLSSATLDINDADAEGISPDRRNGFAGGVYLTLPLRASGFAVRPELLYAQKGASLRASFTDVEGSFDIRATTRLSYLELPLLLQFTVPTTGGLRPQLYAGPALALRTGCRVSGSVTFDGQTQTLNSDCDDEDGLGGEGVGFRRFDAGAAVGGALAFDVGGRGLTLGARYTHGLAVVAEDPSARNRAVTLYGSLELPVARR